MTIPESPYQQLIDVIDTLLVKNETEQKEAISLHVTDIPSLPLTGRGSEMLESALITLKSKGLIPDVRRHSTLLLIPKFDKLFEKKLIIERQDLFDRNKSISAESHGEIILKDYKVAFDDDKATIMVGKLKCPLPPFKNEHYFCRAMFEYMPNEPVDWSLVYKRMADTHEEIANPKKMRTIQDTMYALNNRIKEVINTNDPLFTWENKSVKRNF